MPKKSPARKRTPKNANDNGAALARELEKAGEAERSVRRAEATALAPSVLFLADLFSVDRLKEAREVVMPGTAHAVNVVLHAAGSLAVGKPGSRRSTSTVLRKATIALLLRRLGVTREKTQQVLTEVFSEALRMDKDAEETLLRAHPEVAEAFRHVEAIIDHLPKSPTAAPCSTTVTSLKVMPV